MAGKSLSSLLSNRIDELKGEYLKYSLVLHILREHLHFGENGEITMYEIRPDEEEEFETIRDWLEETE